MGNRESAADLLLLVSLPRPDAHTAHTEFLIRLFFLAQGRHQQRHRKGGGGRDRDRQTDRARERQRERERARERERESDYVIELYYARWAHTHKKGSRVCEKVWMRETDRQTDRGRDRDSDRQTDRQRQRERETHTHAHV